MSIPRSILRYDAPLTADVEAIARPVSAWVRTLAAAGQMGIVASEAVVASLAPPGGVATMVIPGGLFLVRSRRACSCAASPVKRRRAGEDRKPLRKQPDGSGRALQRR